MSSDLSATVPACVAGDMDLVRALGLAGIRSVVLAGGGAPPRFSRFCVEAHPWPDAWHAPDQALAVLDRVACRHPGRPVLFYETDADLVLLSRQRHRLEHRFRFVLPDADLVEDLVDKVRFQTLAERLHLPVPEAHVVPQGGTLGHAAVRFPAVVKPMTRRGDWASLAAGQKALRVDGRAALDAVLDRLRDRTAVVVQELIEGPETAIESYHVYADASGRIVADYTGKKVRTYPAQFGDSTALVTTNAADVRALGRQLVDRLMLRGVAKFDFKRAPDGRLFLLEVNPRFTLWAHLGALAGANIPACVYADLTGQPRPPVAPAGGVRWCRDWKDLRAAHAQGMSVLRWMRWARTCEAHTPMTLDDPWPLLGAAFWRISAAAVDRLPRRHAAGADALTQH